MEFIKRSLDKFLGIFCIALFAFLVLLVTWQVITRFIFNEPSVFSEELPSIVLSGWFYSAPLMYSAKTDIWLLRLSGTNSREN